MESNKLDMKVHANRLSVSAKGWPLQLHQLLMEQFNLEELRTLTFDLQLDWDELEGSRKSSRVWSLLLALSSKNRLPDLLEHSAQLRPHANWSELIPQIAADPDLIESIVPPDVTRIALRRLGWGMSVVVLMSLLILYTVSRTNAAREAIPTPLPTPDIYALQSVSLPTGVQGVTAMTEGAGRLWVATDGDRGAQLLAFSTVAHTLDTSVTPMPLPADVAAIHFDCHQNLWLLLGEYGVMVYRPATGVLSPQLIDETMQSWLQVSTTPYIIAITSRCLADNQVELWLGRRGLQTIRYQGEVPGSTADLVLVEPEDDALYQASQELKNVRALAYNEANETLAAATLDGTLLTFSFRGIQPPRVKHYDDQLWSLAYTSQQNLWVGGETFVYSAQGSANSLATADNQSFGRAIALAADQEWVWFGDRCDDKCLPLGVLVDGQVIPVSIGRDKEVRAITIDTQATIWIGTERSLFFYNR